VRDFFVFFAEILGRPLIPSWGFIEHATFFASAIDEKFDQVGLGERSGK